MKYNSRIGQNTGTFKNSKNVQTIEIKVDKQTECLFEAVVQVKREYELDKITIYDYNCI